MKKKTMIGAGAVGALGIGGSYLSLCRYFYYNALKRKDTPAKNADTTNYDALNQLRKIGYEFEKEHPYEKVTLETFDNLKIQGYLFRQESDRWVIIIHGYQGSARSMFHQAKAFYDKGFNVITFDCRGHGQSEGSYIGMGHHDAKDVKGWIDYIINENKNAKIVIYGVSMGGATTMLTTGLDLPSQVVCAVEDCGYTCLKDIALSQIKKMYGVSGYFLIPGIDLVTRKEAHYSLKDVDCIAALQRSMTPTLFIHGQEDDFVPFEMVFECYEACNAPKEIITASHVGHALAITKPYYYLKMFEFIDKYL